MPGIEPGTSTLPRKRSTPELHRLTQGFERETRLELATPTLEGLCSTNWAIPACLLLRVFSSKELVGKEGFEPPKSYDSRFTVCPSWPLWYFPWSSISKVRLSKRLEPMGGFEPATCWLQISCSDQLSYIGMSITSMKIPSKIGSQMYEVFF